MRTQMLKSSLNYIKTSINSSKSHNLTRNFTSKSNPHRKVTILGASGGVGQPLATLLKLNPLISTISLYDHRHTFPRGVAADISHIPTKTKVVGYDTIADMEKALEGSDVVIITAGAPYCDDWSREKIIFSNNSVLVKDLCVAISKYCPNALIHMITNPVNSTVPIAAEVLKNAGTYDPKRLFGVTTLDVFHAQTSYVEMVVMDPADVSIPVIGGHGDFAVPLISQAEPKACLFEYDHRHIVSSGNRRISKLIQEKAGRGSATLSMAVAGAKFADSCLKALNGVPDVTECAYVQSDLIPELPFFASKVRLGKNGVEEVIGFGSLTDVERKKIYGDERYPCKEREVILNLKKLIAKGVEFVKDSENAEKSPSPSENSKKCCGSPSSSENSEKCCGSPSRSENSETGCENSLSSGKPGNCCEKSSETNNANSLSL